MRSFNNRNPSSSSGMFNENLKSNIWGVKISNKNKNRNTRVLVETNQVTNLL